MDIPRNYPEHFDQRICPSPFWLRTPVVLVASCGLPALLACYLPSEVYQLEWRMPKYFENSDLLLVVTSISVLTVGFWIGAANIRKLLPLDVQPGPALKNWAGFACLLTYLGYFVLFGVAVIHGLRLSHIAQAISGYDMRYSPFLRDGKMETVSGVSTMTQFGIAAVVLCSLAFWHRPKLFRVLVCPMLLLSALRALLNSERLAVLELAIPLGIMWLRMNFIGRLVSIWTPIRLNMIPVLTFIAVFVMFAGMESFRSWRHYQKKSDSLIEFAAIRFGGYYVTSMNNGALLLDHSGEQPFPYYSIEWFWRMPILSSIFSYEEMSGIDPSKDFQSMLATYANPEFNNPGGLFVLLGDMGVIGGLTIMFVMGIFFGIAYSSFILGRLGGLLFYPTTIVCALEMPRFFYYGSHRNFPSVIFLFVVTLLCAVRYNHDSSEKRLASY